MSAVLERALVENPSAEALVGGDERYTYAELDTAVRHAASGLARLGVRPGDRVAAGGDNEAGFVVAFLAAMRLGAIWVGINPSLAAPEIEYQLADSGASVFIGRHSSLTGGQRSVACEVRHWVGDLTEIVESGAGADLPVVAVDPLAPAAVAYTSGTTGRPKGAIHSQHNMMVVATGAGGRAVPSGSDRVGVCLPLALLNLMILGPLSAFCAGAACVLMQRRDPLGLAEAVLGELVTSMAVVPTMLHDLVTHPGIDVSALLATLVPTVGGSDCPPSWRHLFAGYGLHVNQTYGLTEAPTAVTAGLPGQPDGSSGKALPHIEVTIRDGGDRPVATGEAGEICVGPARSGPLAGLYRTMLGYWGDPAASGAALRGGILHTGDIGHLDEAGFLFVHDRRDDLIVRGGANVYPAEVERVLAACPGVAGVAVVGIPDERLGRRVVAAVEAVAGVQLEEHVLLDACNRELARYKVPERIVITGSLPRTSMGKVRRHECLYLFVEDPQETP